MLKSAAKYREFEKQQVQSLIKEKMIELDRSVLFTYAALIELMPKALFIDFEPNTNRCKNPNANRMRRWNNSL